jgi:hypothetical protein
MLSRHLPGRRASSLALGAMLADEDCFGNRVPTITMQRGRTLVQQQVGF